MKLWKYIKNEMLKNPNQIVCEDNLEMSYREIIRFAEDFSKKLKDQKCCAVMCESEFTAARILLACFAAGGIHNACNGKADGHSAAKGLHAAPLAIAQADGKGRYEKCRFYSDQLG